MTQCKRTCEHLALCALRIGDIGAASPTVTRFANSFGAVLGHQPSEIGAKETLGGLERWFSPRGQDLAFLLSRIPRSY
jgi:hypothetical protein